MANAVACGQLDITEISQEDIIAITGVAAWVACDVDEKIYEIQGSPWGYAVIKFNSPCWTTVCQSDSSELVGKSFLMISNALETTILKSSSGNPDVNSEADLPGSGTTAKTICGVDVSLLQKMQDTVDSLQLNEKSFQPAAVIPNAAVIPMKSNVFVYGPWASSNFATTYGGAELQSNPDITPWSFGSFTAMNQAAQELANSTLIGLSRAERGSATLLEIPRFSLGGITSGPTLTDISVSFGSNGVSTTYNYATYTPKFGQLSRVIVDKFKKLTQIRNEQLRFLRQNRIILNKISRKAATSNGYVKTETTKSITDKNSLSRVMVAEIYDNQDTLNGDTGQRTIVGVSTLSKSVLEMRGSGYEKKAFISLDGMYGPVSISGALINDSGTLPRFINLPSGTGLPSGLGWTISPNPPVIKEVSDAEIVKSGTSFQINEKDETVIIDKNYLNPLANPGSIPHHEGPNAGHSIDIVGKGNSVAQSGIITNFYRPTEPGKYANDYRFLAMRGPLVLQSWGYDTDGKPVPNYADDEDDIKNSGIFKHDELTNKFLTDWLQKPKTWPVAPVDLRLDRERGVWVAPKEHKIVTVELLEELEPFGNAKAKIISERSGECYGKDITDEDGAQISGTVIVTDRVGSRSNQGSKSYAYFDTFSSKLLLMGAGASNSLLVGYAQGLWPINTSKPIAVAAVNSVLQLEKTTEIIDVYNIIQNIGKTTEYKVIFFNYNGLYLLMNAGSCAESEIE